jgi:hypothetical protein
LRTFRQDNERAAEKGREIPGFPSLFSPIIVLRAGTQRKVDDRGRDKDAASGSPFPAPRLGTVSSRGCGSRIGWSCQVASIGHAELCLDGKYGAASLDKEIDFRAIAGASERDLDLVRPPQMVELFSENVWKIRD